jgi:hypothetical protein
MHRLVALFGVAALSGCWLVSPFDFPAPQDAEVPDAAGTDAAGPPIALVQAKTASFCNESTQHTLALDAHVRAHDTLVVAFSYPSSIQSSTVSDTLGNTYEMMQPEKSTDPPDGTWFGLAYALESAEGKESVTVELSGTTLLDLYVSEFSGPLTYAGASQATGTASVLNHENGVSSGAVKVNARGALLVGFGVADYLNAGSGFKTPSGFASSTGVFEYQVTGPLVGPVEATATLMTSSRWGMVLNVFASP